MKEYTYNDNSGTMRTTVNISGYNMTAVHGGEESESALTRSTVYRMPRLDEMISLANEMIYKALHDADESSVINGDWLHYGTSDVHYNYPSDENPKLEIRVPASLITFKETGDITFTSYDEGSGQISGSFISTTAEGNVADRVRMGAVFDFLDIHAFGYHWPAFNLADSFICIGAALVIGNGLFFNKEWDETDTIASGQTSDAKVKTQQSDEAEK